MASTQQTNDFMILGPTMASGSKVLAAVHALYYLPDNFTLALTGSQHADRSFFKELLALVDRDGLDRRVRFFEVDPDNPQAVILPSTGKSRAAHTVTGDSPEALASAILNVARA
jgi:hypothetical protein